MERPLVIYHANCPDGFGAAVAAYCHFRQGDDCPCDFVAAAFGHPPPEVTGRQLYIVDFSYPRPILKTLCRTARAVTILDHHISAKQDLADLEKEHTNLRVIFDMEKSGAVLTWEFFHHTPVPRLLLHIQDRDLWRFALEGTNDLYAALIARPFDFRLWADLIDGEELPASLFAEGGAINRYRREMIAQHRKLAVIGTIDGWLVPIVNCYNEIASDLLGELAKDHPFAAGYQDQGNLRKWSLRSSASGADVAQIAKRFGGGGHQHAAGFITQLTNELLHIDSTTAVPTGDNKLKEMTTMIQPIPEGYQSITPMCVFKDARQAIAFYKAAFGAVERFVMPGPDGVGVMHAEIKIGTSLVMLGEESPQETCKSAESLGASPISFYLYLENVDAAYARALAAGALPTMPVEEMFWGDRIGTVKDPFGYTWTLATHVKDPTPQEMAQGAQALFASMATPQPLTITRTFAAPRERVWKAWTEPERCQRWWGPKDFTAPVCKIDLRVGGKYLNCMRSAEGQDFWSTGTYREIVAPERLVCTDSFADAAGNVVPASHYNMSGDWPLELQVTVTLEENAGATRMTLRHDGLPPGEMKEMCAAGWNESFDKLATFLQQEGA